MSDYVTKLRGAATVAEIDGDPFCRFKPEFVRKVADEIERLRGELITAHCAIISDVNQQRDLAEAKRLLRDAVAMRLRVDGLPEEWFERAEKAGGEHE